MESERPTFQSGIARSIPPPVPTSTSTARGDESPVCRQFWRAGDYEAEATRVGSVGGDINRVRVHPKFLHSNATSHKWALGAIAELLDNAMDEVQNGATFVKVDKIVNPRNNSPALLVQDNGGGMTPNAMRECMSLGYSQKHTKNTIGRYGNGFKTSTMRLGADVIVFSSCKQGSVVTQSIGLLSYTFLRKTGREDVVVPMIDYKVPYETLQKGWPPRKRIRSTPGATPGATARNLEYIMEWSPYSSERELLDQFEDLGLHGTKVIVYNLWFNDVGVLELDFDADEHDIQLSGDEKQGKDKPVKQRIALEHISNRYRHSFRVYSSILYLKMPPRFQIILRGKPVEHCNVASGLLRPQKVMYKPKTGEIKQSKSLTIQVGFTREARLINVHGFNVYHKNRLIMPFWKVLQENSSRGRGVVGVLEANFMEPAHDKQDFERTELFLKLEKRLKELTGTYWNENCHEIGYKPRSKARKGLEQATTPSADDLQENLSGPFTAPATGPGRVRLTSLGGSRSNSAANPDGPQVETEAIEVPHNSSKRSRSANGEVKAPATGPGRVRLTSLGGSRPNAAADPDGPQVETEAIEVPHNSSKRSRFANGEVKTEQVDFPHNSPKRSRSANGVKAEPIDVPLNSLKRPTSAECQRTASNNSNADANAAPARDGGGTTESALLGGQPCDKDALIIDLMQENAQLRSKYAEYDAVLVDTQRENSDLREQVAVLVDTQRANSDLREQVLELLKSCSLKHNNGGFMSGSIRDHAW